MANIFTSAVKEGGSLAKRYKQSGLGATAIKLTADLLRGKNTPGGLLPMPPRESLND